MALMAWKSSDPDSGPPIDNFLVYFCRSLTEPFTASYPVAGLIAAGAYWGLGTRRHRRSRSPTTDHCAYGFKSLCTYRDMSTRNTAGRAHTWVNSQWNTGQPGSGLNGTNRRVPGTRRVDHTAGYNRLPDFRGRRARKGRGVATRARVICGLLPRVKIHLWRRGVFLSNPLILLARAVGFEPTTNRLTADCSTAELRPISARGPYLIGWNGRVNVTEQAGPALGVPAP